MDVFCDALPSLEVRPIRSIKHEERKKGQREHASETKEKHAKLRVLVIVGRVCQTCCVEEPQRRIDADSVAPLAIYILLETVDNSEVGQGALFSDWAEDLRTIRGRRGDEESGHLRPRIQALPSFHVQQRVPDRAALGQIPATCHPREKRKVQ